MLIHPGTNNPTPKDNTGVVETSSKPERRIEVDTERLSVSRLIRHAEGSPMSVNFYRLRRGDDNISADFDTYIKDPSQQYSEIKGLMFRVTSPFNSVQDEETKEFIITGESFIDAGVIPNKADVFTAEIGDGKTGLFLLTVSEMMSHRKNASYRVEYQLKAELTDALEAILKKKVSEVHVYAPEVLERTGVALVDEETYIKRVSLKQDFKFLKDYYQNTYFNQYCRTMTLPEQSFEVLDPFLNDFLPFIGLEVGHHYNHPPFQLEDTQTLWHNLMNPNRLAFKGLLKEMGLLHTHFFRGKKSINNVGYSNVRYTVWSGEIKAAGVRTSHLPSAGIAHRKPTEYKYDTIADGETLPLFKIVNLNPYVLSEGFYKGSAESVLELVILDYINRREVSVDRLVMLIDEVLNLPPLDQYYYIPLVMLVMNYVGS